MTNSKQREDEGPSEQPQNVNWFLSGVSKIGPGIFSALIVGSILWIGTNSMQTNVTLAVMSNDINSLKEQIRSGSSKWYTIDQATVDRAFITSEITHLKEYDASLKLQLNLAESRLLELERKVK